MPKDQRVNKITGRMGDKYRPAKSRAAIAPVEIPQEEVRWCGRWHKEVRLSQAAFDAWNARFKPEELEKFFIGEQWPETQMGNYVVNLFYSNIEVMKPGWMFGIPKARLEARPNRSDDPESNIVARCKLLEDSVNAQIQDPAFGFLSEIGSCIHEHLFAFGVSECGYSADVVDNPNAKKPETVPDADDENEPEDPEPEKIISNESLWVRRIPANMFRVSISGKKRLIDNDWSGYFEWASLEDVKANPLYKGRTRGLRSKAIGSPGSFTTVVPSKLQQLIDRGDINRSSDFGNMITGSQNQILLFKLWDHRTKKRHVFLGDFTRCLLRDHPWTVYPFNALKGSEILDEFYPVPPTFNWRLPQEEINERNERNRVHARRFNRKYQIRERGMDAAEVEKLEVGADGTAVWVKDVTNTIAPIQDAMLDPRVNDPTSPKEDFVQVSAIGGEQRALADSETATQANIIDVNTKVRQTVQRQDVVDFLSATVRTLCELIQEYWTTPMYIRTNVDLESLRAGNPSAVKEAVDIAMLAPTFQEVQALDYGDRTDYLYEVSMSMEFLSPGTEDKDRQKLLMLMQTIGNPQLLPIFSASPELFRQFLKSFGVRSEYEVRQWTRALQAVGNMMAQAMQAQAGQQGGPSQGSPGGGTAQEGQLPDNQAIAEQLAATGLA